MARTEEMGLGRGPREGGPCSGLWRQLLPFKLGARVARVHTGDGWDWMGSSSGSGNELIM